MIFLGANYITMLARLHILTIHVRQDNLCHIDAIHLARGLNTKQLSTTLSLGRTSILVNSNRYIFYDARPAIRDLARPTNGLDRGFARTIKLYSLGMSHLHSIAKLC